MQRLALQLNAPAVEAGRERAAALAAGRRPSVEEWHRWALAETGSRREADDAAAAYAAAIMRADDTDSGG